MKVILVSSLCSNKLINNLLMCSKIKPLQSIQKYHKLLCFGLINNNINVEAISAIPITSKGSKKIIWRQKKEIEDGLTYNYVPFINIKYLRQFFLFVNTFLITIAKCIKERDSVFICDTLNISISFSTLMACKIMRKQCIGIVTDLPSYSFKKNYISRCFMKLFYTYDGYVFLTQQMDEKLNKLHKKYIIIEGISDHNNHQKKNKKSNNNFIIMYAGGIYEKYGVKELVNAVISSKYDNIILELYGSGDLEAYIKNINNKKIKYFGVIENKRIVEREYEVDLLVNPRFSTEEYTKYSFPSKNMEYMASGTPLLTTKLPGIPTCYYKYCYFIEDESVTGLKSIIESIYLKNKEELFDFGLKAQKYVLTEKNEIKQAEKLINMIKNKKG